MNEKVLLKRKPTRLANYDYSDVGMYFVTICVHEKKELLCQGLCQHLNDFAIANMVCPYGNGHFTTILFAVMRIIERFGNI